MDQADDALRIAEKQRALMTVEHSQDTTFRPSLQQVADAGKKADEVKH